MRATSSCSKEDEISMKSFFDGNPQGTLSSDCQKCINACEVKPNSQCVFECFGSDLVEKKKRRSRSPHRRSRSPHPRR